MSQNSHDDTDPATGDEPTDAELLATEIEALRDENHRLRRVYERTHRSRYERTAIAMSLLGLVAVLGGLLFPESRTVLVALGGTGLFAALLTYYLTPERIIAASVGERVYDALAGNQDALSTELGLRDDRIYVPTDEPSKVRLFIPQRSDYDLPSTDDLQETLVITADERRRGLSLSPTGEALFSELERTLAGGLSDDPGRLADQLADGVVETFELADATTTEVGTDQSTFAVAGSAFGSLVRFDHPVPSLFAVGLARGLGHPISLSVTETDDERADYLVSCEWEAMESADSEREADGKRRPMTTAEDAESPGDAGGTSRPDDGVDVGSDLQPPTADAEEP